MSPNGSASDVALPARLLGAAVGGFGLLTLLGWVVAPEAVGLLAPGGSPTKPATAFTLLLIGTVLARPMAPAVLRRTALALALAIAADGLLAELVGRGLVFTGLLFPGGWAVHTPDGNGRMALGTALGLLCLSLGLCWVRRARATATASGLVAFAVGYVALLGHLYGVSDLYRLQSAIAMALPTALALVAGATALLFYGDGMPLSRAVHARGTPGALVRRSLPWAFLLPPALGWVRLQGQEAGLYGTEFGLVLMVIAMVVMALAVVLVSARTAAVIDRGRERTGEELATLNAVLAERVATAVAEAEEGRERLQLLLERTPVGIFETGPDGVRRFANRRWRELAGVEEGAEVGTAWIDAIHPEDRDTVAELWQTALVAGDEFSARYRYLRGDGTETWVDATTVAMRAAGGEVTRWLGSVTDVTEQVRSEERLIASEARYRSVVSSMAEGVVLQDQDGAIVTANDSACRLLGLTMDQLLGRLSLDPEWRAVGEDGTPYRDDVHPVMVALRTARPVRDVTMGVDRADGSQVWLSINVEPLLDPMSTGDDPVAVGAVTTFADVTATRLATAALRRSEEQFRTAMEHAPIGMALVELDGRFREVNRALCTLVGYDEDELVGQTFQQITHPDDLEADLENVSALLDGRLDHYAMEKRYITKSGDTLWVLLAVSCARGPDGAPAYFVSQIQDITAARAATEQLTHRALHDALTGLPNRDLLMDHLAHALARSGRTSSSTAVMFCDLDGFKSVNDNHGHEAGDRLLVVVAERLRSVIRPGDTVARLGGDEFVVVAEGLPHPGAVRALAERVRRALAEPVDLGSGVVVPSGGSIGVATATSEDDARSVLREADAAMYRAKARGRDRVEMSVRPEEVPEHAPGQPPVTTAV